MLNKTKPEKITEEEKFEKVKETIRESLPKIEKILRKYCDLRDDYYKLVSIWIIGTYLHKNFPSYPYLFFNAVKGGGKSRILNLIRHLAHKGKFLASMSEAVLFRTAEAGYTFCIDEFERVASKDKANLRELLNAAYKKGVGVERIAKVKTPEGTAFVPEYFEVYTPIVMANIWGVEDVLADRCITLTLEKSRNPEITRKIELFDTDPDISIVKSTLGAISAVTLSKNNIIMSHWNDYVYYYYNGANGNNGNNGYNGVNGTIYFSEDELLFFEKIIKTSLDSRHLELFFPLFFIAFLDSKETLDELINTAENIVKERRSLDAVENRDILLLQFLASREETSEFISIRTLVKEFKEYLGEDEEAKWLNSRWLGRALRRQVLVIDQRHMRSGREVIINFRKVKEKVRAFVDQDEFEEEEEQKEQIIEKEQKGLSDYNESEIQIKEEDVVDSEPQFQLEKPDLDSLTYDDYVEFIRERKEYPTIEFVEKYGKSILDKLLEKGYIIEMPKGVLKVLE